MADTAYANLAAHDAAVNADIRDKTPADRVSVLDDATIRRKLATTVFNNKDAIAAISAPSPPDLIIENNTVTTGDQAGTAGKLHVLTIAGLTADRAFTLPVAASVSTGDRCGVYIADGDDTYSILLKSGASGDLINGTDHSSTEWSNLFVVGEKVIFRCLDGATGDWMVENDGRIASSAMMTKAADITTNSAGVATKVNVDTVKGGVGDLADIVNYRINIRRTGTYQVSVIGKADASVADGSTWGISVRDDASANVLFTNQEQGSAGSNVYEAASIATVFNAGQYLEYYFYSSDANDGWAVIDGAADPATFTVLEHL